MSIVDRPADPVVSQQDPATSSPRAGRAPRTRNGTVWLASCTAAAASVVLIVFMLQNIRSVEITFPWMHSNVPLALALLIAGVGVAVLAMAVVAARIGRLRRAARRHC